MLVTVHSEKSFFARDIAAFALKTGVAVPAKSALFITLFAQTLVRTDLATILSIKTIRARALHSPVVAEGLSQT